jgi:hypothetical protein
VEQSAPRQALNMCPKYVKLVEWSCFCSYGVLPNTPKMGSLSSLDLIRLLFLMLFWDRAR